MSTGDIEAELSRELARAHRLGPAEQLQQHDNILAPEHRLRSTFRNMKRRPRPTEAATELRHRGAAYMLAAAAVSPRCSRQDRAYAHSSSFGKPSPEPR